MRFKTQVYCLAAMISISLSGFSTAKEAAQDKQPPAARSDLFAAQAQTVLAEWFSIDPKHDLKMQQQPIEADGLGARFSLSFVSDDQQAVNGVLAMPQGYVVDNNKPFKLALLLHPMGRDHALWFSEDNPIKAGGISQALRQQGYAVLALDARRHGLRKVGDFGLQELIGRAHSPHRRLYDDMIIGTVRDYRLALAWVTAAWDLSDQDVAVMGYSMGAQMSLLLASYEPSVSHVVSMVPPYVDQPDSPVAPRQHAARIDSAQVLLLAAKQDPYASVAQNQQVFDLISSQEKTIHYFDSGHVLPVTYQDVVLQFIDSNMAGEG